VLLYVGTVHYLLSPDGMETWEQSVPLCRYRNYLCEIVRCYGNRVLLYVGTVPYLLSPDGMETWEQSVPLCRYRIYFHQMVWKLCSFILVVSYVKLSERWNQCSFIYVTT
jgi:hypothetical protein